MNKAQEFMFWKRWGNVVAVNAWKMAKGRLHEEAKLPSASQWHAQVWSFATLVARQAAKAVGPDELRHGAYWLALGRDKTHMKFDNRDLDRVLTVFNLLIDPDNLTAVSDHLSYQRGEDPGGRKRLVVGILNKAPAAYIAAVALDKFGTRDWESLNGQQLFRLNMTLSNRRANWKKPAKVAEPAMAGESYPF